MRRMFFAGDWQHYPQKDFADGGILCRKHSGTCEIIIREKKTLEVCGDC